MTTTDRRAAILEALQSGPKLGRELARAIGVRRQLVDHILRTLLADGLVRLAGFVEKQGTANAWPTRARLWEKVS